MRSDTETPDQISSRLQQLAERFLVPESDQLNVWPSYFPPSCPPSDAKPDNLEAYRFVNGLLPSNKDFESHVVAGRPFKDADHCRACGLSVYRNLDDAKEMRLKFKPLRSKKIAKVRISDDDGVVKQTSKPLSHYTWWVNTTAPENCFIGIEPE